KRRQVDAVDEAEHEGVRADRECERQQGGKRERGARRQRADAVAQVLEQTVEHGSSLDRASPRGDHSYRKATIGSTRNARRAGISVASSRALTSRARGASTTLVFSRWMLVSQPVSAFVNGMPSASPIASPMKSCTTRRAKSRRSTRASGAPSARRTPISRM